MQPSSPVMTLGRKFCPFFHHLAGPCAQKVSFISRRHLADGTQFWQHFTSGLNLWLKCFGMFLV
jgi:hypothetical protein